MKILASVLSLLFAAPTGSAPAQVRAANAQAVVDGDALLFSFELQAKGGPLSVRAVEYVVSVEGARLFAGTAQGFQLSGEKTLAIGGFDATGSRAALSRVEGKAQFAYRVRGLLRATSADGAPLDVPFSSDGTCEAPGTVAIAPVPNHSLLDN